MPAKQRYTGCSQCEYLGQYGKFDLHWCKTGENDLTNLIVRWGSSTHHVGETCMVLGKYTFEYQWEGFGIKWVDITKEDYFDLYLVVLKLATKQGYIKIFEETNS